MQRVYQLFVGAMCIAVTTPLLAQISFRDVSPLPRGVNTSLADVGGTMTSDGQSFYYSRIDVPAGGASHVWESARPDASAPFGPAQLVVGDVNDSRYRAFFPSISGDGLELYFADSLVPFASPTLRPGGLGGGDIWVARRSTTSEPFGPAVNLGPNVNSSSVDGNPHISFDGLTLLLSSKRPGGAGDGDLWMATRSSRSEDFGPAVNLGPHINSRALDAGAALSPDGLMLMFGSNRASGIGDHDNYIATRRSLSDPFGPAVNAGPTLNTSYGDVVSTFSPDGSIVYFNSTRPGGAGYWDLWQASVVPEPAWLTADYDGSGTVEQADLDLVLLNWGQSASVSPVGWINGLPSGSIDQDELDRVLLNWGAGVSASMPPSVGVPEPTTWILLLSAAVGLRRAVRIS